MNARQSMRNELENEPCAINDDFDYDRMIRFKKTLQNRLNLLNIVMPLIKKNHKNYTLYNIDIDIDDEKQINEFMNKTNHEILTNHQKFIDFFKKNGNNWQKNRIIKFFKK